MVLAGPGDGQRVAARQRELVAAEVGVDDYDMVWQSRSGPPQVPWLAPDIEDHLVALAAAGTPGVVVAPIGFVSDHMEVVVDLDTEAAATAGRLGLRLVRVPTVGVDREFVAGLVDLVEERAAEARGGPAPAGPGVRPSVCPAGCCPNLRQSRPALCGRD